MPPIDPAPLALTPRGDQVLIRRRPPEERIENGVTLLALENPETPNSGDVVAVGEGRVVRLCECGTGVRSPMTVKVGDRVLYGRFAGHEVTLAAETYVLVPEEECIAILASIEVDARAFVDAGATIADDHPYAPVSDSTSHDNGPDQLPAGSPGEENIPPGVKFSDTIKGFVDSPQPPSAATLAALEEFPDHE